MKKHGILRRILFTAALYLIAPIAISTWQCPTFGADATASGDRGGDPDLTFPDSFLVQNGGPILDVKRPPEPGMHAAKGDGITDDTEALKDAYDMVKNEFVKDGPWDRAGYYVYLPNGTYLVKDTIIYRGETVSTPHKWTGKFDVDRIKFIGQNRGKTILRLPDNCASFGDAASPKPVLAYQHPNTVFNNAPGGNYLRNITVDTGRGNPGAIGVFLQGANQTDLQHVTVQSGDGAGVCGISFTLGSVQGYYADVTVKGFDTGINDAVHGEGDVNFEYLTLTGQHSAGILHTSDGMSLRRVLSDQQEPNVPALRIDKVASQTVVIDSDFRGKGSAGPAIEMTRDTSQELLVRNVSTSGYATGVEKAKKSVADAGTIQEYVSSPVKTLSPDQSTHTLNLPIQDTPAVPQFAVADWTVVDDAQQFQDAVKAGKPMIVCRKHDFKLDQDINVPASVKVINGMGATFKGKGLVLSEASTDPLFILDAGIHTRVDVQRDVVEKCAGGGLSNPAALPVRFFLENVNDITSGNKFCQPGQKVFARSIDIEYGNTEQIVCNGGALWVFGYKTENGKSAPFVVRNGGSLEVLGGYSNSTAMPKIDKLRPIILNDNANVSASLFVNLRTWPKVVEERRGDQTYTASDTDFLLRGKGFGKQFVVPLYVGREPVKN